MNTHILPIFRIISKTLSHMSLLFIYRKLDDLFAIVRPVVQLQIASGFFSVTTLVFFTLHVSLY